MGGAVTEDRTRHMLRIAADAALMPDAPPGSANLYAIAVAFLSAHERSVHQTTLEELLYDCAESEVVDSDEVLNFLLMQTA